MTLEQLPPKGVKREQAILELGKDEANGELLFQLVNTEKGKCKTAAQKALAQLEYAPAAPLWAKLVRGKWMGSNIMSDACSDCVSEQIAPVILDPDGQYSKLDISEHTRYDTQSLAKFAFSMFWRAMQFAEEQQVPILLDY